MTNEYSILANMYFNGSVEHDEHGMIKVGEYIINFEREEVQMNFLQNNYQQVCLIHLVQVHYSQCHLINH